jgi:hypothetical protein
MSSESHRHSPGRGELPNSVLKNTSKPAEIPPEHVQAARHRQIDPALYLKMLMIGFFENLLIEHAIAGRCEDSLSLRAFFGYGIDEPTPYHSSLSVIRTRLGETIYQNALEIVLAALCATG